MMSSCKQAMPAPCIPANGNDENTMNAIVVLTTTATTAQAEKIAHVLIENQCAACVQILPAITSVYRWQDKVEQATEILLLIKTTQEMFAVVEAIIKSHHSYETPEIIALPVVAGSDDYLSWLQAAVKYSLP